MNHLMTVVNELDRLSQYFVCSEGTGLSEWLERHYPGQHQALLDEVHDHYNQKSLDVASTAITTIIQDWLSQWSKQSGTNLLRLEIERLRLWS